MASFYYILWGTPPLCLAIGSLFLFRRGVHRELPLFCVYIGWQIVDFIVLSFVSVIATKTSSPTEFYRSFAMAGLVISTTLEFLALFELTKEITLPPELVRKVVPIFRWVAAVLVLSAAFLSAHLLRSGSGQLVAIFQTLEFSANLVKLGLLLVLLVCTIGLKIQWKSLPAGLVLGFGIQAAAEMGASALYSALGKPGFITVDMIRMVAFLFCTIIWLVYMIRPEKSSAFKGTGLQVSELELLDQQMQKMMRP
jgi:hypothetical protein